MTSPQPQIASDSCEHDGLSVATRIDAMHESIRTSTLALGEAIEATFKQEFAAPGLQKYLPLCRFHFTREGTVYRFTFSYDRDLARDAWKAGRISEDDVSHPTLLPSMQTRLREAGGAVGSARVGGYDSRIIDGMEGRLLSRPLLEVTGLNVGDVVATLNRALSPENQIKLAAAPSIGL